MKIKIDKIKWIILIMIISGISACKKEKIDEDNSTIETGTFIVHLHSNIDTNEIENYGLEYMLNTGRKIRIDLAQMYISEVELIKLDGSKITVSEKSNLKILEEEKYILGNVPVGNYKSIQFKVGLNALKNSQEPLTSSESVIMNRPEMWFSNMAQPEGYVFLNFQGQIDTSAAMNGNFTSFEYRIGTNLNFTQIVLPTKNFTVLNNQDTYAHIVIDYGELFNEVDFGQLLNLSIHSISDNSGFIIQQLKQNMLSMFKYN
ncbi:MAG: hypothetical protein HYR91_05660 [Flavobacteriia bacterium]|nr:hypothetical protein [Flavobacteriia bacterium]